MAFLFNNTDANLNNLIQVFAEIAQNHAQINDFGFGEVYNIASQTVTNYPLLWVSLLSNKLGNNTITYKLRVFFMDLVNPDITNESQVKSDAIQILNGIYYLLRDYYDLEPLFDVEITPFEYKSSDGVFGAYGDYEIEVPNTFGYCDEPMKDCSASGTTFILFPINSGGGCGGSCLTILNSETISWEGSGSTCQPFIGNVNLSVIPGNILAVKPDGLYASGSTVIPGGNNQDIQFNDNGVFGGSDNFTWNNSSQVLGINGSIAVTASDGGQLLFEAGIFSVNVFSEELLQLTNGGLFGPAINLFANTSIDGTLQVDSLASTGTTMVVATSTGLLETQPIPQGYTFTGNTSQYTTGAGTYLTFPTNLSSFTNGPGYITGITAVMIDKALGYTPLDPSGTSAQYFAGNGQLFTFPTNLNQFINGPGYITGIAAIDGLSASGTTVLLGQNVGQAGSPASLLSNREIPLNGFGINLLGGGTSTFGFNSATFSLAQFFKGTSGQNILDIITVQGQNPPSSSTYGNFHITLDESFVNPDGQRDSVLQWGYNQNGEGGTVNTNECEVHYAIESHYPSDASTYQNEIHLETTSINGNKNRIYSFDVNTLSGNAIGYFTTNSLSIFASNNVTGNPYFVVGSGGELTLSGATAFINMLSSPGYGNFIVTSNTDGSTSISNEGGGANPVFSITTPLVLNNTNVSQYDISVVPINGGSAIGSVGNITGTYYAMNFDGGFDGGLGLLLQNTSTAAGAFSGLVLGVGGTTNANNSSLLVFRNTVQIPTDWTFGMYGPDGSFRINNNTSGLLGNGNRVILTHAGNYGIGDGVIDPVVPAASAVLSLYSTQFGFLPPCMTTTQKSAIASPADGLMVYDLTLHAYSYWNASTSTWGPIGGGGVTSFNTRTGAVTLLSSDVTGALGFTPISLTSLSASSPLNYNNATGVFSVSLATNSSYGVVEVGSNIGVSNGIISLQSSGVTGALGFTPVSSVSNSDGSLTISPTTGAVVASLNVAHGNTWTAAQIFKDLALSGTTAAMITLENTTAAVSGNQQVSPSLIFQGSGYGTTGSAAQTVAFQQYVLPVQGTTPTGTLIFGTSINGAAFSNLLTVTSTGVMTLVSAAPEYIAQLTGSGTGGFYMENSGGAMVAGIQVTGSSGEIRHVASSGGYFPTFYANNAEAMRINTNGRLMIGTTTDNGELLQVNGTGLFAGQLTLAASTTSAASLVIPTGTAPTSPVEGQMWKTGTHLFIYLNGATVQIV